MRIENGSQPFIFENDDDISENSNLQKTIALKIIFSRFSLKCKK